MIKKVLLSSLLTLSVAAASAIIPKPVEMKEPGKNEPLAIGGFLPQGKV